MRVHGTPTTSRPMAAGDGGAKVPLAAIALGLATAVVFLSSCRTTDDRPATWEYISPVIFQPMCATGSCHDPASAVSGLDLSTPDHGYLSLTALWVWIVDPKGTAERGCMTMKGTVVCQRYQRPLVVPFNPSQSRLVNVLRAQNAPRMPPNRPLPEADIALVEKWILNGAIGPAARVVDAGSGDGAGGALPDASPEGGSDSSMDAADAADATVDSQSDSGPGDAAGDATSDAPRPADASPEASTDGAGVN